MPTYQCTNIGMCPRADACEKFEVKAGESFACASGDPNCHEHRIEVASRGSLGKVLKISIFSVAIILILIAARIASVRLLAPKFTVEECLTDVWPWLR